MDATDRLIHTLDNIARTKASPKPEEQPVTNQVSCPVMIISRAGIEVVWR